MTKYERNLIKPDLFRVDGQHPEFLVLAEIFCVCNTLHQPHKCIYMKTILWQYCITFRFV